MTLTAAYVGQRSLLICGGERSFFVAGDKSGGSETKFYKRLIRIADQRYDAHLDGLGDE